MYRVKSIMNYNGTYRLDDEIKQYVGRECTIDTIITTDVCVMLLFMDYIESTPPYLVTSPVRVFRGKQNQTDLTIKTQETIYELELIKEDNDPDE